MIGSDDCSALLLQDTWTFKPPSHLSIVGGFASPLHASGSSQVVDVAVQMPASSLHEKDFSRHRYHAKRLLFLHHLSQRLSRSKLVESQGWSLLNDDARYAWTFAMPQLVLALLGPERPLQALHAPALSLFRKQIRICLDHISCAPMTAFVASNKACCTA